MAAFMTETYLGDEVWASYDGERIRLRERKQEVVLTPGAVLAFARFMADILDVEGITDDAPADGC